MTKKTYKENKEIIQALYEKEGDCTDVICEDCPFFDKYVCPPTKEIVAKCGEAIEKFEGKK